MSVLKGGRLVYVINHMDWFWSHRIALAQGALQAGYEVYIAAPGAETDEKLKAMGFKGVDLPSPDQGIGLLAMFKTLVALRHLYNDLKPDIVHAITLKYAFIAGLAALGVKKSFLRVHTIAGLGYLFSGEGIKPKLLRFLISPLLRLALKGKYTRLIFQNPDDQALLIARGMAEEAHAFLIKGSGVDLEVFQPDDDISLAVPPIVLMPTRLVHDKGVAVFIEAAKLLQQRGVQADCQIAGGVTRNNPQAISESEMAAMVADGSAQWLGRVDDMPGLLARSTVIAYPSYYREGVPKVLLEAAAMAKPIVTTDHPGCREAVKDTVNGLLVPIKDPMALADAIECLLKDEALCHQMGRESRLLAGEIFDVRKIVERTLLVYDS